MKTKTDANELNSSGLEFSLSEATICLLRKQGESVEAPQLFEGLPVGSEDITRGLIERAIRKLGFKAVWKSGQRLEELEWPLVLLMENGRCLVALGIEGTKLLVVDPAEQEGFKRVSFDRFATRWGGETLEALPTTHLLLQRHGGSHGEGHWFWGRIFKLKRILSEVVVASLFANVLALVTSLFAMQVYDRVIPGQSVATLWVLAGGVGLAIFFEAVLRISRAALVDRVGKDAEVDISSELFSRLMSIRLDRRPAPPGALVHMVREFSAVKEFFTNTAVGVVADLPFVFVFLAVIYAIAGNVMWVIVIGALLIVLPNLIAQSHLSRLSKETMGGMSSASRVLTEVAYGAETVRISRLEPFFQKQWEEIIGLNALKTTEQRLLRAILTYWATSVQQLSYIFAVIVCVYLIFAGELTTGAIIAVGILTTRTLSPISQLSQALSSWQNMKTSLNALDAVMDAEQEREPGKVYIRKPLLAGHVALKKVRYAHPNARSFALDVEGSEIAKGSRIALLGANGSGKTTFLRLVAGLQEPTEGEVLLDGLDIRQLDPTDLRRNVGYLPQEVQLFRGTLRDNLAAGLSGRPDDELMSALEFAGLGDFVTQHPEGLDLKISDGGLGLSSGQKQCIGIARVVLQDPSVVLLDEPTSALDQNLEAVLVPRIGKWLGARTCIVATHRPQILSIVSSVSVLHQGKIVLSGERDQVLAKLTGPKPGLKAVGDK